MEPVDLSLLPQTATIDCGRLLIGGVDVLETARFHGTPLFLYDETDLRQRFQEAYDVFGSGVAYATKAFLCKAVARLAYSAGLSLDVSTGGEYHVCREAGVPAASLEVHGNNKKADDVTRAIEEGVQWIVLDSFDDMRLVAEIARELRRPVSVLVRVNPGAEVHTHRYNATGNRESKFGFPLWTGDAEKALREVTRHRWLEFRGVHIHIGSLVFSLDCFLSALDSVLEFVSFARCEVFVVGGGLGVRYLNSDEAPTFREWSTAILDHCRYNGANARVLAEPGRCLVARAAVTLYTVGSLAKKDRITYAAVDGGMSDNPRPLLYESGYEAFLVRRPVAKRERLVTIVGRHCESGDTLVRDALLPEDVAIGDVICTPVTGAYGYAMASNYNKMLRPEVIFVREGESRIVVRRETYADLLACDIA